MVVVLTRASRASAGALRLMHVKSKVIDPSYSLLFKGSLTPKLQGYKLAGGSED